MPNGNKNDDRKKPWHRNHRPSEYVRSVLALYTALPDTPARPRPDDRFIARRLELQKQPFIRVQAALLLGTARRVFRPSHDEPLTPIRSIRYFLPVIDEVRFARVDHAYLHYLANKIEHSLGIAIPIHDHPSQSPTPTKVTRPRQPKLPW